MQRARKRLLLSTLICAALVSAGWLIARSQQAPIESTARVTPASLDAPANNLVQSALPHPRKSVAQTPSAPALPPDADLYTVIETMKPAAAQGSAEAMRRLGDALRACQTQRLTSDSERLDLATRNAVNSEVVNGKTVASATNDAMQNLDRDQNAAAACAKVADTDSKLWRTWLERAAQSGDRIAQKEFSKAALSDYTGRNASDLSPEDLEDLNRIRSLAYQFDQDLLADHDCSVLGDMSTNSSDAVNSYIYSRARNDLRLRELTASGKGDSPEVDVINQINTGAGSNLSPSQLSSANRTASYLVTSYCSP